MANRPVTTFLQSERDFPSPDPSFPTTQAPQDTPPDTDAFQDALKEGIPDDRDYPKWVINLINLRRREHRERLYHQERADIAWERYNNRYDFSQKEGWQSTKVPPKVYILVERLASLIYRVKEKSTNWFDLESLDESSLVYYNLVKHLIKWFLSHDMVDFDGTFRRNLKTGLLWQMMYLLICWEDKGHVTMSSGPQPPGLDKITLPEDPVADFFSVTSFEEGIEAMDDANQGVILPGRNTPRLCVKCLNPDYVFVDHSNRGRYMIWEVRYTRGEARREAKVRNWDPDATERGLTKGFTTDATTDNYSGFHEARDAAKQERIPDHKSYQKAKVTYFFGDFFDETTGELLMENCFFAVLNDSEIVERPVPNPFWDGEIPIIAAPITEVPFSAYGKSPIVQNMDMFELYVEQLNMMIDYFQAILLGMNEVDLDLVDDYDEDFRSGLYPGKLIKKRAMGQPGAMALTKIPMADLPAGMWQAWGIYGKEVQDNAMVTDAIGGQARSRGRVTAMEFNRRAADAGDMISFIFDSLQSNYLAPAIRKCFHVILQFMPQRMWANWVETHKKQIAPDSTKPELMALWNEVFDKVKLWTPADRWRNLAGFFRFKVRIYSALADKQAEIEKSTFFAQTASQIPGMAQYVKWQNLGRMIARGFDWDPEEIISEEALALPPGAHKFIDPSAEEPEPSPTHLPQPGGFNVGAPQSISTSPPFAPGTGGPGQPP